MGTTDNDYEGSLDHMPAGEQDVAYLLEACNEFFGTELGSDDVTGAYAGVRPLIATGDPKKSVDISRQAELYETSSGLVTITGGKLTTWRRMAKMAVDRIVVREGREAPCRTHEIPIGLPRRRATCPTCLGSEDTRTHLAARYGYAAAEVLAIVEADPARSSASAPTSPTSPPRSPSPPRRSSRRSLGDVLLRRTRLGLLDARAPDRPRGRGARARGRGDGRRARLGRRARSSGDRLPGARWPGSRGWSPPAAARSRATGSRRRP